MSTTPGATLAKHLSYTLVVLDPSYLEAMLELDRLCYGGYWGSQNYLDELIRPQSDVWGWIHDKDQRQMLAGFGILWRVLEEAHLISLAIHPDHRRHGLARSLIEALLTQAQTQGSRWATLEVRASNLAAQTLYERCGFTFLGQRPRYYQDPDEDGLIYWRSLEF